MQGWLTIVSTDLNRTKNLVKLLGGDHDKSVRISLNVITEIGIMISHFGDCDRCHLATGRNEVTRG